LVFGVFFSSINFKVQFTCFDRQSALAMRLMVSVRKDVLVKVDSYAASFTESVMIPKRCIKH
jgi:hypothetical protein